MLSFLIPSFVSSLILMANIINVFTPYVHHVCSISAPKPEVRPTRNTIEVDDELSSLNSMVSFDVSAIVPNLDPEGREEVRRKMVSKTVLPMDTAYASFLYNMEDTDDSSDKLVIVETPEVASIPAVVDEPSFKVTTQLQGKPCK